MSVIVEIDFVVVKRAITRCKNNSISRSHTAVYPPTGQWGQKYCSVAFSREPCVHCTCKEFEEQCFFSISRSRQNTFWICRIWRPNKSLNVPIFLSECPYFVPELFHTPPLNIIIFPQNFLISAEMSTRYPIHLLFFFNVQGSGSQNPALFPSLVDLIKNCRIASPVDHSRGRPRQLWTGRTSSCLHVSRWDSPPGSGFSCTEPARWGQRRQRSDLQCHLGTLIDKVKHYHAWW